MIAALLLVLLEDFECKQEAGCVARITEDGVVEEVQFRKNDMVSTEAGWVVSLDDGWVKVKTSYGWRGWGNVHVGGATSVPLGIVNRVPRMHRGWAGRPALPPSLGTVGL